MPSTATAVRPRPVGPPMLCAPIDEVPDSPTFVASIKYDGWRAIATVDDDGNVTLSTREGHPITVVDYVADAVRAIAPAGTVLDGELVDLAGPRQLKRTGSILQSSAPHVPAAGNPPLTFAVFDVLFAAGEDLRDVPLGDRIVKLEELFAAPEAVAHTSSLLEGGTEPVLMFVEHRTSCPEWAQEQVDAGHEGVVVKLVSSLYRHGARDAGWWKWKPQETEDAECIGFTMSTTAEGVVAAINYRLESGVEGSASSGISDAERTDMTSHPDAYLGRLIAVAHHGVEQSGRLRSPVYRGIRDPRDKASADTGGRAPRTVPDAKGLAAAAKGGGGRKRNYRMGDEKLLRCIAELDAEEGDAYDRCLERGSGDPAGDLAEARRIAHDRGLI